MLLLIGDQLGHEFTSYINGAVVSLRVKGDRLALWSKRIDDVNIIQNIGSKVKDLLNLPATMSLSYEVRSFDVHILKFISCFQYHEAKFDEFNREIRLVI
jgi:hypothetical protein